MEPDKTKSEGLLGGLAPKTDNKEVANDKTKKEMKDPGPNPSPKTVGGTVVEFVVEIIDAIVDGL